MKVFKKTLPVLTLSLVFFMVGCCKKKEVQTTSVELDANCNLKPDPGLCKGAFTMYYYNPTEKKCKSFIWGGCGGVVPFKTLEECQEKCNCEGESK